VFAVGLSREIRGVEAGAPPIKPPGAALVLGKVMNAFLLDHIQNDIDIMNRVNTLVEDGERAFGPGFLDAVNDAAAARGGMPYRRVQPLVIRPSQDIGHLAAGHVRTGKLRGSRLLQRQLMAMLDIGEASEADLASYLLFDGSFAKKLIDLGRADAEARRHDVAEFFGSAEDDGAPEPHAEREWVIPPAVE
jgi:NTE family protein